LLLVDNLDVQLELRELESKSHSTRSICRRHREELVKLKLFTETPKKFWDEIEASNSYD
jgi:hypothetical protein